MTLAGLGNIPYPPGPMTTDLQVRRALKKIEDIDAFVERHAAKRISRRTVYRQRGDSPPPMRDFSKNKLVLALIEDGIIPDRRRVREAA